MKKVILVKFKQTTQNYAFFADDTDTINVGDSVVVAKKTIASELVFSCAEVTKVQGLTPHQRSKATKWIVQKIDPSQYFIREQKEELAQEIKNQLRLEKEAIEEQVISCKPVCRNLSSYRDTRRRSGQESSIPLPDQI